MADLISAQAERYAGEHTSPFDEVLGAVAAWTRSNTGSPGMMSGLLEARLLEVLIVVGGARQVLEIGTFTGLGALTMAAALPEDGRVTTLEVDPQTAATARGHIEASPYRDRIELIEGNALETLDRLPGPFDLVYIDAWKADYPKYWEAVVPKLADRGWSWPTTCSAAGARFRLMRGIRERSGSGGSPRSCSRTSACTTSCSRSVTG